MLGAQVLVAAAGRPVDGVGDRVVGVVGAVVGIGVGVVGAGREDEPGAVGAADGEGAVSGGDGAALGTYADLALEEQPVVLELALDGETVAARGGREVVAGEV